MATILIPDYLGQQVLSGARSLHHNGDICTLAWKPQTWIEKRFSSHAITDYLTVTPSHIDSLRYVEDLISIISERPYDMLMPFGLSSFFAISKYAEKLSPYIRFMVSDFAAFELANDKLMTARHAASIGLVTPRVHSEYQESDIHHVANHVQFPVVIKARTGSGIKDRIYFAHNQAELVQYYQQLYRHRDSKAGFEWKCPLIQEYIPGYVHDACALAIDGDVKTVFTQKRKMMYPITGGVGAVNVSTHDPELVKQCRILLDSLNWHGPAQVEFKFDPRDNQYKLIEINPKFWGTLDLSIKAGVNFPFLIRNYLVDGINPTPVNYKANLEYKFYFPQYVLAKMQLLTRRQSLNLKDSSLPPGKAWRDFQWSDYKPDLLRAARAAAALVRRDWQQGGN